MCLLGHRLVLSVLAWLDLAWLVGICLALTVASWRVDPGGRGQMLVGWGCYLVLHWKVCSLKWLNGALMCGGRWRDGSSGRSWTRSLPCA